jgi:hypothetical protein
MCCVTPIIDVDAPYGVFSHLLAGPSYMLFSTNPRSCYASSLPDGACCFPDGSCQELSGPDCGAQDGDYRGDGVSCAEVYCPPPTGACCFPDESCWHLTAADCALQGGSYQADNFLCTVGLCDIPTPTGACCFPDESCWHLTAADCALQGGSYQGDNFLYSRSMRHSNGRAPTAERM